LWFSQFLLQYEDRLDLTGFTTSGLYFKIYTEDSWEKLLFLGASAAISLFFLMYKLGKPHNVSFDRFTGSVGLCFQRGGKTIQQIGVFFKVIF
jgi:hypothetical protein